MSISSEAVRDRRTNKIMDAHWLDKSSRNIIHIYFEEKPRKSRFVSDGRTDGQTFVIKD